MSVVLLADAKTHLNITGSDTSQDAEVQSFLDSAEDMVTEMVGPLAPAPFTDNFYGLNAAFVVLSHIPAVTITSATLTYYAWDTPTSLVPATDLIVDPDAGIVRRTRANTFTGDLSVTYTAGWVALPNALKKGILELTRDLYQQTQQAGTHGGYADSTDYSINTPRWRVLLEPYTRGPRV